VFAGGIKVVVFLRRKVGSCENGGRRVWRGDFRLVVDGKMLGRRIDIQGVSGRSIVEGKLKVSCSSVDIILSIESKSDGTEFSFDIGAVSSSGLRHMSVDTVSLAGDDFRPVTCISSTGERGGLLIARSRRLLGRSGWNIRLKDGSLDGEVRGSPQNSAGVLGRLSTNDIQLSRKLSLVARAGTVAPREDDLGGIVIERPERRFTSITCAFAGAKAVAHAYDYHE
jgi:hypothetical protein